MLISGLYKRCDHVDNSQVGIDRYFWKGVDCCLPTNGVDPRSSSVDRCCLLLFSDCMLELSRCDGSKIFFSLLLLVLLGMHLKDTRKEVSYQ